MTTNSRSTARPILRKLASARIVTAAQACAGVSLCLFAMPGLAQTYTVTDLGTLSGNSVSAGAGLNDLGQAAGNSSNPTGDIAVLFANGKAISLGTLVTGDVSVAEGINSTGEVVGYVVEYPRGNAVFHAFLYSSGAMHDINSPSLFPAGGEASGINSFGEVVGTGYINSYTFHAFLYSGGRMTDISPPGTLQGTAVAINASGEIIGGYYLNSGGSGEYLYSNGKLTTLPVPAGASAVGAFAINDNGEIAGALYLSSGSPHAASFANGTWTDLGAITGASSNTAKAINASGQIVGTAVFPQVSYHPPKPGKHVPFISTAGGLVDLNTLIPAGSGFTLTDAVAINESGQILCDATTAAGSENAVLLSPK